MNQLKISQEGLQHLKQWEGLSLRHYKDVGGELTIGIGHLLTKDELRSGIVRVSGGSIFWRNGITEAEALLILDNDTDIAEMAVNRLVEVPLAQNQFDALVSFTFNVGVTAFKKSTLLKKLNAADYGAVPSELKKWRIVKGKVSKGLVNRRNSTAKLWRQEHIKPAFASRTNQGAATAAVGQVLNMASEVQMIKDSASSVTDSFGEYAQWVGIVLTIAGIGYVLYARYDDRRNGVK